MGVCDSETFVFELSDKSQIRSIHYLDNSTHFNAKLYEKFISSIREATQEKDPEPKAGPIIPVNQQEIEEEKAKYFEYTVEPDDSLFGIALKFDVNIQVLESINRISGGNVYPNQVLTFYLFLFFCCAMSLNCGCFLRIGHQDPQKRAERGH